jgi:DNA-binding MarR family transcriptional regulator
VSTSTHGCVDPLVAGIHDRWDDHELAGSPWPFMSICALGRLFQFLQKALDTELKKFQLSKPAYYILTTLALTTHGRARLSTLSRLVMMHPTSVKLTVDQLEAAGLVTRGPHPHDGRATLVFVTDKGRERAGEVNESLDLPGSALAPFGDFHRDIFEALQPAREVAGDMDFSRPEDKEL